MPAGALEQRIDVQSNGLTWVSASAQVPVTVANSGPGVVQYGTASGQSQLPPPTSAFSQVGTIASGSAQSFATGTWLLASSSHALVTVTDTATPTEPQPSSTKAWLPAGAKTASFNRCGYQGDNLTTAASGTLYLVAVGALSGGQIYSTVSFVSGTTAAGTPLNQWFCLVDQNLNVLVKTADDTTTAWGANTVKTLTLTTPYVPPTDIGVYAGNVVVATNVPSLRGANAGATNLVAIAPPSVGVSTTGLTNPASLGATAGAITAVTGLPYCWVS